MTETLLEHQPRMTLFDTQPIEALEAKISQVLEHLAALQSERNELQKQVAELQSQHQAAARQLDELSRERDALKRNQRDPQQEELIRTKITALLAKLEAA
jgi:FtsZ-binding cell division protein ZapB